MLHKSVNPNTRPFLKGRVNMCTCVYWKDLFTIFCNRCFSLQELRSAKTEIKQAQAKTAIKSFVEVINFNEEPMWVVIQSIFCEIYCVFLLFGALSGIFLTFFLKTNSLNWLFPYLTLTCSANHRLCRCRHYCFCKHFGEQEGIAAVDRAESGSSQNCGTNCDYCTDTRAVENMLVGHDRADGGNSQNCGTSCDYCTDAHAFERMLVGRDRADGGSSQRCGTSCDYWEPMKPMRANETYSSESQWNLLRGQASV